MLHVKLANKLSMILVIARNLNNLSRRRQYFLRLDKLFRFLAMTRIIDSLFAFLDMQHYDAMLTV